MPPQNLVCFRLIIKITIFIGRELIIRCLLRHEWGTEPNTMEAFTVYKEKSFTDDNTSLSMCTGMFVCTGYLVLLYREYVWMYQVSGTSVKRILWISKHIMNMVVYGIPNRCAQHKNRMLINFIAPFILVSKLFLRVWNSVVD